MTSFRLTTGKSSRRSEVFHRRSRRGSRIVDLQEAWSKPLDFPLSGRDFEGFDGAVCLARACKDWG